MKWVCYCFLEAKSAILQLYYGESKFDEMMVVTVFVLDQQVQFGFYSASSLKQQFAGTHVAPHNQIIHLCYIVCHIL